MRLIDADAFDEVLQNAQTVCKKNGGNFRYGVLSNVRANLAKMPTVCGWISVKDDLPKEFGEPCIVYNGSSVQYGDYFSNGEWYTPDCYESDEIIGVTHWMPLPEPPKEENSGNEQHMP